MTIDSVSSSSFVQSNFAIQQSSERVASGQRINSAADDAAGQAIATRFSADINEFSQAARNANDGVSFLQATESGLNTVTQGLERIRELSLQASNGTLNDSDRSALNQEALQLRDEITRTIETTSFNGQTLLNNSERTSVQVGEGADNSLEIGSGNLAQFLEDVDFQNLDISTRDGAQSAIGTLDQVQAEVDSSASEIGGQLNRLDSTISNLFNSEITASASRSRIEDADIARETSELAAAEVRQDASIALQAQANQRGQDVLRLLGP